MGNSINCYNGYNECITEHEFQAETKFDNWDSSEYHGILLEDCDYFENVENKPLKNIADQNSVKSVSRISMYSDGDSQESEAMILYLPESFKNKNNKVLFKVPDKHKKILQKICNGGAKIITRGCNGYEDVITTKFNEATGCFYEEESDENLEYPPSKVGSLMSNERSRGSIKSSGQQSSRYDSINSKLSRITRTQIRKTKEMSAVKNVEEKADYSDHRSIDDIIENCRNENLSVWSPREAWDIGKRGCIAQIYNEGFTFFPKSKFRPHFFIMDGTDADTFITYYHVSSDFVQNGGKARKLGDLRMCFFVDAEWSYYPTTRIVVKLDNDGKSERNLILLNIPTNFFFAMIICIRQYTKYCISRQMDTGKAEEKLQRNSSSTYCSIPG